MNSQFVFFLVTIHVAVKMGFCDKTPFLSVFLGAADLTVVWAFILLTHNKSTFMKHPTCAHLQPDPHTRTRLAAAKKMRIWVSCDNVITFCGPQAASPANYPRNAVPGTGPVSAHVKDNARLGDPNSLKRMYKDTVHVHIVVYGLKNRWHP